MKLRMDVSRERFSDARERYPAVCVGNWRTASRDTEGYEFNFADQKRIPFSRLSRDRGISVALEEKAKEKRNDRNGPNGSSWQRLALIHLASAQVQAARIKSIAPRVWPEFVRFFSLSSCIIRLAVSSKSELVSEARVASKNIRQDRVVRERLWDNKKATRARGRIVSRDVIIRARKTLNVKTQRCKIPGACYKIPD